MDIEHLYADRRPHDSVVKVIEAFGICLGLQPTEGAPASSERIQQSLTGLLFDSTGGGADFGRAGAPTTSTLGSDGERVVTAGASVALTTASGKKPKQWFKVSTSPSNYEATMNELYEDYYGALERVVIMDPSSFANDVANALYAKCNEPEFSYEDAMQYGGAVIRDVYNALVHILDSLHADPHRMPLKMNSTVVAVDGSRQSYVALDAAIHTHKHGKLIVAHVGQEGTDMAAPHLCMEHLRRDFTRRCLQQYGVLPRVFELSMRTVPDLHEASAIPAALDQIMKDHEASTLVLGQFGIGGAKVARLGHVAEWAAWQTNYHVIVTTAHTGVADATPSPAPSQCPRTFMIASHGVEHLSGCLPSVLGLMRPGDAVHVMHVLEALEGETVDQEGENDGVAEFIDTAKSRLKDAQVEGDVFVERRVHRRTVGQHILDAVGRYNVEFLVVRRGIDREVSLECTRSARCSIILVG